VGGGVGRVVREEVGRAKCPRLKKGKLRAFRLGTEGSVREVAEAFGGLILDK